jgi:hypothetical protein
MNSKSPGAFTQAYWLIQTAQHDAAPNDLREGSAATRVPGSPRTSATFLPDTEPCKARIEYETQAGGAKYVKTLERDITAKKS